MNADKNDLDLKYFRMSYLSRYGKIASNATGLRKWKTLSQLIEVQFLVRCQTGNNWFSVGSGTVFWDCVLWFCTTCQPTMMNRGNIFPQKAPEVRGLVAYLIERWHSVSTHPRNLFKDRVWGSDLALQRREKWDTIIIVLMAHLSRDPLNFDKCCELNILLIRFRLIIAPHST